MSDPKKEDDNAHEEARWLALRIMAMATMGKSTEAEEERLRVLRERLAGQGG